MRFLLWEERKRRRKSGEKRSRATKKRLYSIVLDICSIVHDICKRHALRFFKKMLTLQFTQMTQQCMHPQSMTRT